MILLFRSPRLLGLSSFRTANFLPSALTSKRNLQVSSNENKGIKEPETQFVKHIKARIKIQGGLSVADFMKDALINPVCGYYMHKNVIGAAGDFVTSPEISQVFGELIAIWFIAHWQSIGSPKGIKLLELGPGRGTLMADMLRTFRMFKPFYESISGIHLVEASPTQRNYQRHFLSEEGLGKQLQDPPKEAHDIETAKTQDGVDIKWHFHLSDVPKDSDKLFMVAHEFFDAIPVHQFEFTSKGWCEVLVDIDESETSPMHFRLTLSSTPTVYAKSLMTKERFPNPKIGDRVEISPDSWTLMTNIAERIGESGGAGLIIDYGENQTTADSIRAIKNHKFQHLLSEPGTADLSADVDFSFLRKAVESVGLGTKVRGPLTQRDFLLAMGIQARLQSLAAENPKILKELLVDFQRLTGEKEMGIKYKFLCVHHHSGPNPHPFS